MPGEFTTLTWDHDKRRWRCHLASLLHHDVWHWLDEDLPALPGNLSHLFGGPHPKDVLNVVRTHVAERFDVPFDTIACEMKC